jgi:hypothetical protein
MSLLVVLLVAFQFWLARQPGGRDSLFEALPLGVLLLAVAGDLLYRMNSVVRISPERVVVVRPLLPSKVAPRDHVRGLALRGVYSFPGSRLYAVVYDDNNRCIATLPEGLWDDRDLRHLQTMLGPKDHAIKYVTSNQLRTEFPGALTAARYAGWVLAVTIVILIFVGVSLR